VRHRLAQTNGFVSSATSSKFFFYQPSFATKKLGVLVDPPV
jgi:hypothetical protein